METNEIMTNDVVAEATETIVTEVSSNKNLMKTVAKIGGTAIIAGGALHLSYKYVIKPLIAKFKAKDEQSDATDENGSCEEACDVNNAEEIE